MSDLVWIRAVGPASLSNLGPGFDALGLAINTHQDVVEAARTRELGVEIQVIDEVEDRMLAQPDKNTASIAALSLLRSSGADGGLRLRLKKGIPLGSGIGGSAASAVAGAVATAGALGIPIDAPEVVDAAMEAETWASGSPHGDNVLPAFHGGLIATTPSEPLRYQRIGVNVPLSMALVLPSITVLTKQAREALPAQVPFSSAIRNAAAAAQIVAAFVTADWRLLGECIMMDEIVEPVRAAMVPGFAEARSAALSTGAYGAALSGSGPAMFAICAHDSHAHRVAGAMSAALAEAGVDAETFVAHPVNKGAEIVS